MAQTGYTPILIYASSTGGNAPAAGNLTNSSLGSELAINITDGKLFYKDNANAIQVIGWKTTPTTAGGTGLTSYTAGDLLYYASGTTLSKLAIGTSGQWLGSSGTAPQWNSPAALTKTDDTNVTLTLGGSASTALLNAASLTLGWTGQLAVTRGGTGLSTVAQGDILYGSAANTLSALAKNTTATRYLSNTGTSNNPAWAQIDLTNGVTGTLPTGNGGTGLTSFTANGIVYASSTSALATGSGLTFDGTNFATTGTIKGGSTISVGGATPAASGAGVTFPATQSASSDANTLDDYEEGTWTPIFTPAGGGTITTTDKAGYYTKIGRIVHLYGYINIASVSTPTGDLRLANFPFNVNSAAVSAGSLQPYGWATTAANTAICLGAVGNTDFAVVRGYDNGTQVSTMSTNAQANAGFQFHIAYQV